MISYLFEQLLLVANSKVLKRDTLVFKIVLVRDELLDDLFDHLLDAGVCERGPRGHCLHGDVDVEAAYHNKQGESETNS